MYGEFHFISPDYYKRFRKGAEASRSLFTPTHASEREKIVFILVVIAVVIRAVDNVEIAENPDGV